MTRNSHRQQGFTLIEIVMVIAILGILAAVAIPKFVDLTDDAHTAVARGTFGGFTSGVTIAHAEWIARGTSSIAVSVNGWPSGSGNPPMTHARCATAWNDVLTNPPFVNPGFITGADGWGAWGFGDFCLYIYQADTSPFRILRYNVATGLIEPLII